MKANELMLGDWATSKKWREKPFKITRINDSGKYYYGITAEGSQVGPFLIEELEPIPLTAEILEKNGFRNIGGHWYDDAADNYELEIEAYCDSIWRIFYHSTKFNIGDERVFVCHIHELQHALHLFGIEKELEL